jgi:hypothetical protein
MFVFKMLFDFCFDFDPWCAIGAGATIAKAPTCA